MTKKLLLVLLSICIPLAPVTALGCAQHLAFDPNQMGFFGGAVARLTGLAPPPPVFEMDYPAMSKAEIGATSEIAIKYERPFFSKNVTLQVSGTKNVEILQSEIPLEEREGVVNVQFKLVGTGFDNINLVIMGEHRGKNVRETGRIYLRAKAAPAKEELQVSER